MLTKSRCRSRVHRNDSADSDDLCHVATGENGWYPRKAVGELHILDQFLSCGPAAGSPFVFFCVASQIW